MGSLFWIPAFAGMTCSWQFTTLSSHSDESRNPDVFLQCSTAQCYWAVTL